MSSVWKTTTTQKIGLFYDAIKVDEIIIGSLGATRVHSARSIAQEKHYNDPKLRAAAIIVHLRAACKIEHGNLNLTPITLMITV